jgi:GNAT superfamily N-acetyltransferase
VGRKNEFHSAASGYTYEQWDDDPEEGHTAFTATSPEGDDVGTMMIDHTGEVTRIDVEPEHRRKGVATGMWNYARSQGHTIRHSDMQTEEGRAWASAVGD